MSYYIGIDLATSWVGLVMLGEDDEVIYHNEIHLPKYSFDEVTRKITYDLFTSEFKKMQKCIDFEKWDVNDSIGLYIEMSNFSNAKLTQRFSRLSGIVEMIAIKELEWLREIKHFNANEWRRFFVEDNWRLKGKSFNSIDRELWKSESVREFKELTKIENESDNIADAYFIAKYGPKCRDVLEREHVTHIVKELKKMQKAFYKKPTKLKEKKIYDKFEELKELNEKVN